MLLEERGLLDQALEGAAAAGVDEIISVGLNLEDSDRNRRIAERHPGVYFTCGWHPHEKAAPDARQLEALAELLRHPKAVAVGEVGLDLFFRPGYHEVPLDIQQRSFRAMLELASDAGKPVLIHDRDAHDEVLAAVSASPAAGASCTASAATPRSPDAAPTEVSSPRSPASSRFRAPRASRTRRARSRDDGFVVETDSPFLSPVPERGKPNLPERVAITAAAVARLRGETVEEVRAATTRTAHRVLGIATARAAAARA